MISDRHYARLNTTMLIMVVMHYVLAGVWVNPFIIWTILPLYISYFSFRSIRKSTSLSKLYGVYGFFLVSMAFSLFYHTSWFFGWDGVREGSTSALIFVWFPIYAVVLGGVGFVIGLVIGKARSLARHNNTN